MTQYILAYKQTKPHHIPLLKYLFSTKKQKFLLAIILNIILIFIFGIIYIIFINDFALSGQKINNIQKNLNQLKQENLKLEIQLNALKSPQNLYTISKIKNLTEIQKIIYITDTSLYLVKK